MKSILCTAVASISLALVFFLSVSGEGSEPERSFRGEAPPGGAPPGGPPPQGHRGGPPPHSGGRQHTATEAETLDLVPADQDPPAATEVDIREQGNTRAVESNGIPDHRVGRFPNRKNPHEIQEQSYEIEIPLDPSPAEQPTFIHEREGREFRVFGVTLDGVMLEPGTAETWMGSRESGWNYEALGGAVPLGLDANYGHVQPGGNYHYHGLPTGLMKRLGYRSGEHSPLIGWAADGFPIYALYGYSDPNDSSSVIEEMKTGYRLKSGQRPGGKTGPGGKYDGAFVQDYEFAGGAGALDECNGRFCVTPEYPEGTYAYFLTREWPVVPRAFRGIPEQLKGPPAGRGHPGGGLSFGRPDRFPQ
ncbi:MAG: YHYH protein [Verrucomicrobiales bacterium]|nr:YHYH protein [Verrucomicrobiales bacterium]